MKRFKYFALAALVAFGACDEGGDPVDVDPITGTVTASVTADGAGIAGVTVNLVGPTSASQTTPASGQVSFANVEVGAYAVTISGVPSGFVCSNTSQTVTISSSGQTATASFTCSVVRSASISGQVTANGEGVGGATIAINGPDGSETTQTGTSGNYQFTGLVAGSYTVTLQAAELGGIDCVETSVTRNLEPGESEVANFSCGGGADPATVTIERITNQAGIAVDRQNVMGIIVIQVGVDEGGQEVEQLNVDLVNNDTGESVQICTQTLSSNASGGPLAIGEEFEVDCVVNTAAIRSITGEAPSQFDMGDDDGTVRAFDPIFLNDDWQIVAQAITEGDALNPTATTTITLANADVLALNVEADNPDAPDFLIKDATGLRWLSGSLTFDVYPIIYSAPFDPNNPNISRVNFGFDSYVSTEAAVYTNGGDARPVLNADATPAIWRLNSQTPITAAQSELREGSFRFVLPDTHTGGAFTTINGINTLQIGNSGGVDDLITGSIGAQNIAISTITAFGQFGPGVICANISTTCTPTAGTVSPNPLRVFYQGVLQSGTGAVNNVLRVDNQEPWTSSIRLDPHPLATMFSGAVPGTLMANGATAVRGGMNIDGFRDGWLNHAYEFDSGMWTNTGAEGTASRATDAPNLYATHPNFTLPTGITASTTRLAGIGVDASTLAFFAAESETGSLSAFTITGITAGTEAQRLRNASGMSVETGADLPDDEGPGLDLLDAPNSNEWDDISLVAIVADLFANAGFTNILEIGVDGHAPEFRNRAGDSDTDPDYPTDDGTVYNTYGDRQASNPRNLDGDDLQCMGAVPNQVCTTEKVAGVFEGTITDANNGFSGAAGVSMSDWENGCATGVDACSGSFMGERVGVTWQAIAGAGPTQRLVWEWSKAAAGDPVTSTFVHANGAAIEAWDATAGVLDPRDGYRQQQPTAWDRAANNSTIAATEEHNADKTRPLVGNVEMPTVTSFMLGSDYTYGGQSRDGVDLKYTDFAVDYNTITTIQTYADPVDDSGAPFAPNQDALGNPYVNHVNGDIETAGNSIQLPMADISHTAFGSASIVLRTDLSVSTEFVGCIALFDEGGAPDNRYDGHFAYDAASDPATVHIPRGPRWRTVDHAYPYGLNNHQYNTFTPSSVPTNNQTTCANGMTANQIRGQVSPSANTAGWDFGIGVQTGGTDLELSVSGPSGTFVPGIDITMVDLYYIDQEGRVRILDLSGTGWTGPQVEDVGTGALGRTYTWTYSVDASELEFGTLVPTNPSGHDEPYFFTVRFGNGTAILWDDSANM